MMAGEKLCLCEKCIDHFGSIVGQACIQKYNSLPKKGKPRNEREWTVLAGIVMSIEESKVENKDFTLCDRCSGCCTSIYSKLQVVSLATGNKCLSKSQLSPDGDVLNDSHAEVLVRRALLSYLYDELLKSLKEESSIFIFQNPVELESSLQKSSPSPSGLLHLKPNIAFHLYMSQTPCMSVSC